MNRRDDIPRRIRWPVVGGLVAGLVFVVAVYATIVYGLTCAMGGCS